MSSERAYWLAWSSVPGVSHGLLPKLQQHCGSLKAAWEAEIGLLATLDGLGKKTLAAIATGRPQLNPEQLLETHSQKNPNFWTPADPDYPRLLLETFTPPPLIYYRGQVDSPENQGVRPLIALVGTRQATDHGLRWTRRLSSYLSRYGFTIVATGAPGIDTAAHRSCLEAGGRTIAVLGTGVDIIYPPQNRQLYQQIAHQGLLISQYPAGTTPERAHFPARNRLVAALVRAVLVMEAPETSGTLTIANWANELGRDVYILPNSPEIPQARGSLRLLQQGAHLILDEEELLIQLGAIPAIEPTPTSSAALPPDLAAVWQVFSSDTMAFDLIVQKTGLDTGTVSASLLQLELMGLVSQLPGMRYHKTS